MEEENNKSKIQEEIAELKTRIKNTEYDLTHMFKGNSLLEQKLEISKKTLEEKKKLLEEISPNKNKTEEIRKFEDEITEKDSVQISEQQEEILEEEIEEELTK